ncbi:hypothetical protein [Lactiplantibacillus paraplantarum]|uniref:hypothetical protein n=1 Tax=Lactiplantibacillus paraplantarum TaxID=60520 RepID=UPI002072F191|nr:hypothetical protein [Lactiplantibacillus paraplantarum]
MYIFFTFMFLVSLIALAYFSIRGGIHHFTKTGVNRPYKKYTLISVGLTILFLALTVWAAPSGTARSSASQSDTASSSKAKKSSAKDASKRKASISKANSIKEKESSESALSSSKKQSEAESSSIAKASSESLVASSSSAKKASETSKTDNASYTQNGGWTTAASGMVFVSDSNKYYTSVKNPGNYQYMTQSAADNSGAKPAPRGNQYARP